MGRGRLVFGILLTLFITSAITAGVVFVGPSLGDGPLFGGFSFGPPGTPVQGDSPGVVPGGSDTTGENYVAVTFRFDCVAAWCDLGENESMTFRIQQANRSEFEWEGLYAFDVRDGSEVEVSLFVARKYRLLLKIPDGRIINLTTYQAKADSMVTLRLTEDAIR